MQKCVDCLTPVATKCIETEEVFSFGEPASFNDLLHKLDNSTVELKKILSKNIDKKWMKEDHEFITDYIQEIINKIDVITKTVNTGEQTFTIQSVVTGGSPKNLLQMLTIFAKEIDAIKSKLNNSSSSLYIQNV